MEINGIKCMRKIADDLNMPYDKFKEYIQILLDHSMI